MGRERTCMRGCVVVCVCLNPAHHTHSHTHNYTHTIALTIVHAHTITFGCSYCAKHAGLYRTRIPFWATRCHSTRAQENSTFSSLRCYSGNLLQT